jgi:ERCC4-type nuclease
MERKTVSDLIQSIKGTRYEEQKWRMLRSLVPGRRMLLIEGELPSLVKLQDNPTMKFGRLWDGFKPHSVYSSLFGSQVIQDVYVAWSKNIVKSAEHLGKIGDRRSLSDHCF